MYSKTLKRRLEVDMVNFLVRKDMFFFLRVFSSEDRKLEKRVEKKPQGSPLKFPAQNGRARDRHKPSFCAGQGFAAKNGLGFSHFVEAILV